MNKTLPRLLVKDSKTVSRASADFPAKIEYL